MKMHTNKSATCVIYNKNKIMIRGDRLH